MNDIVAEDIMNKTSQTGVGVRPTDFMAPFMVAAEFWTAYWKMFLPR